MNVLDTSDNFLGIVEEDYFQFDASLVVIQQLPYEYSSSYGKGSDLGPAAILASSHYVEYYDIELQAESYRSCGIASLPPYTGAPSEGEPLMEFIRQKSRTLLDSGKFLVSLGAEHSVTFGVFKAVQEVYPGAGILQLDAHSDLRQEYGGTPWSHACVMARIHELDAPIFQVGIRAQEKAEAELYASSDRIHCWYDHLIHDNDLWMDELIAKLPEQVYITLDADGFDALVCPSVGTIEPGGLGWYQSLRFLRKVFRSREVVGFDIVELNPGSEQDRTAYNMAQLCYKLIGYRFVP